MNKRIEELAKRAGFKNYDGTSLYSPYIEGMELNDELQEFAELIIEECILSSIEWCGDPDVREHIEEHFGVKQ